MPLYNPWSRLRWPVVLLLVTLAYGVSAFMLVEGLSFVDSLYMTLIVLTTVGLADRPQDTSGELITMSLMVLGVTFVLVSLSLAAQAVIEGGLGEVARRRRMQRRVDALKDHYILCAYGRVGRTVARELEAEGAPFVVIDILEELEEQMIEDGVLYIIGDPAAEGVLEQAGVKRAKGLICAVDSDASNVYIVLAARSLNPDIFIVARASGEGAADRLGRAGANRVLSPYVHSGRHMALQVLRPRVVDYVEVGGRHERTDLRIEQIEVLPESDLVGKRLGDACGENVPLAVRRADGEILPSPSPDLTLQPNDMLMLLGRRETLGEVEK